MPATSAALLAAQTLDAGIPIRALSNVAACWG